MKRGHFIDAAVCVLLATVSATLYRKIVRLWWMFDDPFHLNILEKAPLVPLLTQHDLFPRGLPAFTPLFIYSLTGDLSIFGLNARAFYVHQLIAFALLAPL